MKTFYRKRNDKQIKLTIKDAVSRYSCVVDVEINGEIVAKDTEANICMLSDRNGLFLNFKANNDKHITMCICDKTEDIEKRADIEHIEQIVIKNREIADYIWENIQNKDESALSFSFTTYHWRECEE